MYALETLSIESEPDDHNFDEKCDSYEEWSEDEEEEDLRNEFLPFTEKSTIVKKFTQAELNDLVRDLGLPKDGAEYLASTLKRRNMLESGTNASYYRTRNESFKQYFEEKKFDDEKLVHCNNVEDLMKEIKCNIYKTDEWRLFIDSSKRSLKAVLLHNTNKFASIPIAHSTTTKETYGSMKILLESIKYNENKWLICGDLKVLGMLMGQQSGFTKYPCFKCLWDSRDRINHYTDHKWSERHSLEAGHHNVINSPLVDSKKVLLPPLHIKLGIMKQFVKALSVSDECYKYLESKFSYKSDAKLKEGIFDGPEIRKLPKDEFSN
uniref:Reverse transcriptase RNase H-like domain-containing protein n=1 Tax=Trichogramma kaykai TaxID=54128 RepID=A0ABD2WD45_9HYME